MSTLTEVFAHVRRTYTRMSVRDLEMLCRIPPFQSGRTMGITELAGSAEMQNSSVSRSVAYLTDLKLVQRSSPDGTRSGIKVSRTKKGEELLKSLLQKVDRANDEL